jgi:hypothetical protein
MKEEIRMRKVSNVVTGTPLKQSSPAAIERYLVDKVRNDLGDLNDLAIIKPILRIDREDGDLSGNITDGFGTIVVSVGQKSLQLPFIIHQKQLLPFDVIQMGEEKVTYDMAKLRKLVIALDKHQKEQHQETDSMSVVDSRDIPTHNGFLGTIMSVRDSHRSTDANGSSPFAGENFGQIDDARLNKTASAVVDVSEAFEEFHEKLASVTVFTDDDVKLVAERIEKQAASESQKAIDAIANVHIETKEMNDVQREVATLDKDKLVDASRVASGNNVVFPVFNDQQFEYRHGRVYNKIESLTKKPLKTDITKVVIDNKGHYAFLKNPERFMVSSNQPKHFEMSTELSRGLNIGHMYAFEKNVSTLSVPFLVDDDYITRHEDTMISVPERASHYFSLRVAESALFRNAFLCTQQLQTSTDESFRSKFTILLLKDSKEAMRSVTKDEIATLILETELDAEGVRIAENVMQTMSYGPPEDASVYLVGEDFPFFKLEQRIQGHFTRPDGFFKEGPLLSKTAAYEEANKARLSIHENPKPVSFTLEWSFSANEDVEGNEAYNLQQRKMENLSPAQARKTLQDLGFDARKQEMFFEIAKRNGRYAEFRLPSVELASRVTPQDQGTNKAKSAVMNIANSTLHAGNFMPVFEDIVADGLGGVVSGAKEMFAKRASESLEVAMAFEKIAERIRGKHWAETAQVLNMKHHMDKLASDIVEGFVKDAEPLFRQTSELQPVFSKMASALVSFNREQLLHSNKPLVDPMLIKEALTQLDEFSEYAHVAPLVEKQASFFIGAHVTK